MWKFLIMLAASAAATKEIWHPAVDQALLLQIRKDSPADLMSVSSGAAIPYCQANNTLNTPLLTHTFFMDQMTNQVRERINVRPVHAKGAGAFGYFEVTHDISDICKAKLFNKVGKRTPIAVRFSQATGEKGASELSRGVRGFAVRFYTEDGNFDIPGINVPMFFTKDPINFTKFVYSLSKDPSSYLYDPMKIWDIIVQFPESMHMFLHVFGDRGIPKTYRHMPGFNIHTMQVVNELGVRNFVRYHLIPDMGIKHMETGEAQQMTMADPNYYTRDLYETIAKGDFPSWTMSVQIVTEADVQRCGYYLFDVTHVLPTDEFPLHPLGKIVLNRNPTNYFAEIEQLAICPDNLVEGIQGAPDKIYEARRFAYTDAQLYRLGPDVKQIAVNCPLHLLKGTSDHSEEPVGYKPKQNAGLIRIKQDWRCNNFGQAADLYENEMSQGEQTRLQQNVIAMLTPASPSVRQKIIEIFTAIHPGLGRGVAQGFNSTQAN